MAARTTQYGFEFGAATVERLASHKGYAIVGIRTPRMRIDITVTPSGLLRFGNVHPVKREKPRRRR